ncbi:alpha/beta hydrolase-fold protein [Actinoplanes sp. NEAU-A12]|uniref:Alpha/beta hydrolase-fold protein n=1 Tax=Actinoplanes sandaracinus TaxID=3045177 RepID=A0ABT6X0K2_9ACTN|nr:alpha/beta hydrolase-fold protein [Actinoplanes sandaracinus]MDI6105542.1 alpha/beta hydrolase-fold protein [Actinoplanes sandaracinus]
MEGTDGAWCDGSVLRFRRADPGRRLAGVRVLSSAFRADLRFRSGAGAWELSRERPPLWRLEYRLELTHRDGAREDEGPRELRCPGYAEPDWLRLPAAPGRWRSLRLPVGETRVWSPAAPTDRVLVAHDGPEYQHRGALADYTAAAIGDGRVSPYHLVLLPISDRERNFSADPGYARVLGSETLPRLRARLGGRPVVGAGASLGALAMLHVQRRFPEAFAGLFLQSGSYFQPRHDRQESGFRYWGRIVRFVREVRHARTGPAAPTALTCGAAEENLANNRDMADALREQGYPVDFTENPDAHTWTGWRDTLHPHLTGLLRRVWPD